ncbi:putative bifunctional dTTP/UTP pyrophosphatase/methyltransferase protein [Saccoglossus kowalevskii]|uniref:Acetylserotonin O-methyltransferase n=1 Tax=Saccoglossus kowalevskii TaxID=10224 RepID=A0ABM0GJR3_SACKO|nr:PREDICTED: N-acetylserotonin O-methyltransferase-like protein-like [Saccoglossus kowalevskii]
MAATVFDLWHHINGFMTTQSLITTAKLGIFDYLTRGAATLTGVSDAIGTDRKVTEQLIDYMVCLGYLDKKWINLGDPTEGEYLYTNTEVTNQFLSSSSDKNCLSLLMNAGYLNNVMNDLDSVAKIGQSLIQKTPWDDPVMFEAFFAGMRATAMNWFSSPISKSFDLSTYCKVCDLGGGTGDVSYSLSVAYPQMKITIFDLPPVIKMTEEKKPEWISPNVTFQSGDFFTDTLPTSDCFILSNIIHDWPDDKVHIILSRVFKSLESGGSILVAERLLDDDKRGPPEAHIMSLIMTVLLSGKHRSFKEMSELLRQHGFVDVKVKNIQLSLADVIIATKT